MIWPLGLVELPTSQSCAAVAISWSSELRHPLSRTWPCFTISAPRAATNSRHSSASRGTSRSEPPTNMRMVVVPCGYRCWSVAVTSPRRPWTSEKTKRRERECARCGNRYPGDPQRDYPAGYLHWPGEQQSDHVEKTDNREDDAGALKIPSHTRKILSMRLPGASVRSRPPGRRRGMVAREESECRQPPQSQR